LGWTVLILPYIEQSGVSQEAVNKYKAAPDAYGAALDELNALKLPMYLCPSDQELPLQHEKDWGGQTAAQLNRKGMSYAGVAGSYFARTGQCPGAKSGAHYCIASSTTGLLGPNNYDGLLIQGWGVDLKQATDGTSNTFMIGERIYQIRTWMIGAYWNSPTDPPLPQRSTQAPDGPQPSAAFFACKNVSDKYPPNYGPPLDFYRGHNNSMGDRPPMPSGFTPTISVNDLPFASYHTGGVNFSMGDGGVRFISDGINVDAYLAYASRNGDDLTSFSN
jgi:prepilin-type processing-associated H-X9-DG protein